MTLILRPLPPPNRIGNSRSVTALHKDNYENIYVQIRGKKHFVLLPPHCHPCVNEKPLRPGTYSRSGGGDGDADEPIFELVMDAAEEGKETDPVPFATWDPDSPHKNATPYSKLAEPMRVTLEEGDMLYLPAMWYGSRNILCVCVQPMLIKPTTRQVSQGFSVLLRGGHLRGGQLLVSK